MREHRALYDPTVITVTARWCVLVLGLSATTHMCTTTLSPMRTTIATERCSFRPDKRNAERCSDAIRMLGLRSTIAFAA